MSTKENLKLIQAHESERLIAELKRRNALQVRMMESALVYIRAGRPEMAERVLIGNLEPGT